LLGAGNVGAYFDAIGELCNKGDVGFFSLVPAHFHGNFDELCRVNILFNEGYGAVFDAGCIQNIIDQGLQVPAAVQNGFCVIQPDNGFECFLIAR
jgi:hypothetical protein